MTLKEIDELIKALEQSSCTFSNCEKLASLHICKEHFKDTQDKATK